MGRIGHIATHRALIDYCRERLALDTDSLIRAAGLEKRIFLDPDGSIDDAGRMALWTEAYRLTGDPDLALHVAEFRTFAETDGIAAQAPTVGAAFEDHCAFWCWFDRSSCFDFVHTETEVGVTLEMSDGSRVSRARAQLGLADLYLGIRKVTYVPFVPARLEFSSRAPSDTRELTRLFQGCPLAFDQAKDRLWLRRQDWDAHVLHDHHYGGERSRASEAQRERREGPLAVQVRRIVEDMVGNQPISLHAVARKLCTSPRTLQRRLNEQGLSFAAVVDEARKLRGCALLRGRTHSIAAIAFLLGFSEQSVLTRACRRWTGTTPARYRRNLRSSAPADSMHASAPG